MTTRILAKAFFFQCINQINKAIDLILLDQHKAKLDMNDEDHFIYLTYKTVHYIHCFPINSRVKN